MAKGKKSHKKSDDESDITVSDVSDISVSDVSDISISDVSDVSDVEVSSDEKPKKQKKEKKAKEEKPEKKEKKANSPRPKSKKSKGIDYDPVDESSSEDCPEEDDAFAVQHQEWIETVMKDEMRFTITDPLQEGNRMRPYTTYLMTLYPLKVEIRRRYSEFETLRETLLHRYPALLINPLPPKTVNKNADDTVLLRMKALEKWMNDIVRIPYVRMDTTFRDFISVVNINWTRYPEKNSLKLHNPTVKKEPENDGFVKYQEFMVHVKCPDEIEAQLKAFKEQVEKLVEVTKKTVDSIHTMIAHQNAFTQAIDVMSTNMKELMNITQTMNYSSLKADPKLQEHNETIVKTFDSATKACNDWFAAADFIPSRGGRALGDEMEGILLQTQGLSELFQRRWNYLGSYVELWHKKDAALFQVHRFKRDGKKAKAAQAQAQADQIDREVRHNKKYLTRFTKMILNGELQLYVQRQMEAVVAAFSKYAACSQVSYSEQLPVWEVLGKEILESYESLREEYKQEFDKIKELNQSDVEELSSDSEDEKPAKTVKVVDVDKDDDDDLHSESESVPEVDSSDSDDSDDLDNVSDSDEESDL